MIVQTYYLCKIFEKKHTSSVNTITPAMNRMELLFYDCSPVILFFDFSRVSLQSYFSMCSLCKLSFVLVSDDMKSNLNKAMVITYHHIYITYYDSIYNLLTLIRFLTNIPISEQRSHVNLF